MKLRNIFFVLSMLSFFVVNAGFSKPLIKTKENNVMHIVMLGAPGAGKGTQAALLAKKFHIKHISTGDMLREAVQKGTEIGKKVDGILKTGQLVSDDIMLELIQNRIKDKDCKLGFILDGFPRNITQAEALDKLNIKINYVIEIDVTDDAIVKRLGGRRVHLPSGRTYHVIYNPPKVEMQDDITYEPLVLREDDKEDTIRKRLVVYHESTQPLIKYYVDWNKNQATPKPKFITIKGIAGDKDRKIEDIFSDILVALK